MVFWYQNLAVNCECRNDVFYLSWHHNRKFKGRISATTVTMVVVLLLILLYQIKEIYHLLVSSVTGCCCFLVIIFVNGVDVLWNVRQIVTFQLIASLCCFTLFFTQIQRNSEIQATLWIETCKMWLFHLFVRFWIIT